MRHPNAFYLDDRALTLDNQRQVTVIIRGFRDRQLVECEYPDGSRRLRPFRALTAAPLRDEPGPLA